jgi:hypothetical protein
MVSLPGKALLFLNRIASFLSMTGTTATYVLVYAVYQ